MNIYYLLALLFSIAAQTCFAFEVPECHHPRPFFYSAQKDGRTIYLFGTMHIGLDFSNIPERIHAAFDEAKAFAFEADREALQTTYDNINAQAKLPPGQSLKDFLKPESIAKLTELFGAESMPRVMGIQAWAVLKRLERDALEDEGSDLEKQFDHGLDMTLLREAKQKHKPIVLLDRNIEYLLSHDWLMPPAILDRFLSYKYPLAHARECAADSMRVMCSGREAAMQDYMDGECPNDLERADLVKRNRAWLPDLETLSATDHAFVAVGAGHLIGPTGLIALLKERGYDVNRIDFIKE